MFGIANRATPTRVVVTKTKTTTRSRQQRRDTRCSATPRDSTAVDRRTALGAMFAFTLAANPRAGALAADDDASFTSKLSAKEAQKAKILAEARAKAQAQATPAPSAAKAPTNATMFMTEDPGRGGGPDAPNVAVKEDEVKAVEE